MAAGTARRRRRRRSRDGRRCCDLGGLKSLGAMELGFFGGEPKLRWLSGRTGGRCVEMDLGRFLLCFHERG